MGNIRFYTVYSGRARLVKSLELITQIKKTYGRPVICLSGLSENSSLVTRAKLIADFYNRIPLERDAFLEAFDKCVKMLPGFDEVHRKGFKGNAGYTST